MSGVFVRPVQPGDGEGCAHAWSDAGRYYAAIVPEVVHEPDPEGLTDWFERAIAEDRDDEALWLVATDNGRVVDTLEAAIRRSHPDARPQLQRDLSRTRLLINALAVIDGYRRHGVGTTLMEAVEEWGRQKGAVIAIVDTNLRSALSVPFYEHPMGYEKRAIVFRKPLS